MTVVASALMLLGGLVALLAGVGVLRFSTPYARFHAAGKASPIAFLVAGLGAALELGVAKGSYIVVAATAMTLTLPVGVHLLFRAVYRTTDSAHLLVDELKAAETAGPSSPTEHPSESS